ncbi:MAG TPA: hypothetical protein VIF09_29720 [Polyangiaceae bacterium]
MAAKAWGSQQKAVEEVFFQNEAVSLCLLINRRARTMRVIDFRAGPTSAKRLFVLSLAQREGVEKAYTLVERDEVATWVKLGFAKEGNIPGFYKRSDAFLLGCTVPPPGRAKSLERVAPPADVPSQSEVRLSVAEPATSAGPVPMTAAQELMERTILTAKKHLKDFDKAVPTAKVAQVSEADARKAVAAALRSGRALTAFEPFGRDAVRRYFVATARGGFELHASTESQACFGNAYLELLHQPRTESEKLATIGALKAFCDKLLGEGVVSCFSLAPSDDLAMATAFLHNGFRRTGLLLDHLMVGTERKDAILWSRKLANPSDE